MYSSIRLSEYVSEQRPYRFAQYRFERANKTYVRVAGNFRVDRWKHRPRGGVTKSGLSTSDYRDLSAFICVHPRLIFRKENCLWNSFGDLLGFLKDSRRLPAVSSAKS